MKKKYLLSFFIILIFSVFGALIAFIVLSLSQSNETIVYKKEYDYQTGPTKNKKISSSSNNPHLDYFFGDSAYQYLSYNYKNNNELYFNGDIKNVKKTRTVNQTIKLWKNDFATKQLIIFKTNNQTITDVKLSINALNANAPELKANFILPIKAHNQVTETSIPTGDYLSFDEIAENSLLNNMNYEFQPILISATSFNETGNYNYTINLSFKIKNQTENITIPQKVLVTSQDLNESKMKLKGANSFNFDSMINPTQSQKFIYNDNKTTKAYSNKELPINNKYLFWETWDYQKYANNQTFLKDENQQYFTNFYQDLLNKSGMTYGYTPNFGINFIKFGMHNKTNIDDLNNLYHFNKYTYEDFFKSNSLEWIINFEPLDTYVQLLIKSGFTKLYIPIIARHDFAFPFVYSSKNYDPNTTKPNPRLNLKTTFIDKQGNLTNEANIFYQYFFPFFVKKLTNHISESYKNGKYKINNKDFLQFYFSFDETKFEIDQKLMNLTKANDDNNVIQFHSYTGWEFEVDKNNNEDIKKKIIDEFEEVTLQQREYLTLDENTLRYIVKERKKQNKITRVYSSWKNYPAAYLGSNPAESFWGEIIAHKLGFNGYNRYALDYFANNITQDQEDTTSLKEPGDSYLIYPGKNNKPWYSLRLINFIEGINAVIKEKTAITAKQNEIFPYNKVIKNVENSEQNTEYKWNLDLFPNEETLKKWIQGKDKFSISEQVAAFKNWIYLKM